MAHIRRVRAGVSHNRQLTSLPWIVVLTLFVRNVKDVMNHRDPKQKLERMTTYFKQFPSDIQLWKKDIMKTVSSYFGFAIKRSGTRTSLRSVRIESRSRSRDLKRLRRIVRETLEGIGARKALSFRFATVTDDSEDLEDTIVVKWKKRLPTHQASLRKDFEKSLIELYEILMSTELPISEEKVDSVLTETTSSDSKTPVMSILASVLERLVTDIREGPSFRLRRRFYLSLSLFLFGCSI